jgi:hypothetical protein
VRTIEQYAEEYARLGLLEFRREHGRPALIGMGIVGELRDNSRGRSGTLRMQPAASGPVPAQSLVGRIWQITKGANGPRAPAISGGRASSNDIVLPEFTISNHHFHFRYEATRLVLIDLGSTNGSYVNGQRLEPEVRVAVANGAKLVFGRYQFEFMTAQAFVSAVADVAGIPEGAPVEVRGPR